MVRHYASESQYAAAHLYLYKNRTFRYENSACLYEVFSQGVWKQNANGLTFESDYHKENLPVRVNYRKREARDSFVKQIDFIKDYRGQELTLAGVRVNSDSTLCFYGDSACSNSFEQIDSIQIVLETGPTSAWISVPSGVEIIEITVLPAIDFTTYTPYNERFRLGRKGQLLDWK